LGRNELHHDEEDVLLLFRREDRDDVRMAEARKQPRLAEELAEVDALLVRNLERDLLVDPGVFGEVNRAEASAAQGRQDLVLPDDLTAEEHLPAQYINAIPNSEFQIPQCDVLILWCIGSLRRRSIPATRSSRCHVRKGSTSRACCGSAWATRWRCSTAAAANSSRAWRARSGATCACRSCRRRRPPKSRRLR